MWIDWLEGWYVVHSPFLLFLKMLLRATRSVVYAVHVLHLLEHVQLVHVYVWLDPLVG